MPYIVLLSGTHVTGKEMTARTVATNLQCPYINGEMAHTAANFSSRSADRRGGGLDPAASFGNTWYRKMSRLGLLEALENPTLPPTPTSTPAANPAALITVFALRKFSRNAIKNVMREKGVRVIIVILQITTDTLSGRTLGAEEEGDAVRIMASKAEDLRPPEGEEDVLVVDSMQQVDALIEDIEGMVRRQVEV